MFLKTLWVLCGAALRRNRFPALVLQAFAAGVLLLYFLVPPAAPLFAWIGQAKAEGGLWFPFCSTALFGGLIPWVVLWHRGRIPEGQVWQQAVFYVLYWGGQGLVVDALYRQQAIWFGTGRDFTTLVFKVLVDQLPFNLLWGTPVALICYTWKDQSFSVPQALKVLRAGNPAFRYLALQLNSWIVWVPAVPMIYSLPADLQIPMQNLVLCFFSLLLAFVAREA